MKIVYYTDQVYLHGGIERVLANKVNYWVKERDFEVHIITSEQKEKPPCYPMSNKVIFHDLEINYNRKKSYLNPANFKKIFNHFGKLKKKILEIQPDIIIVCNFSFDFYFIPYICPSIIKIKEFHASRHFQIQDRNKNKSLLKSLVYKINDFIESKYHYLVLLTEDEKKYYKSDNTIVIPNALTNYSDVSASLDAKKVISAGRVAPIKGFDNLIHAWSIVSKQYPDWSLEIYGNGEDNYIDELQKIIDDLGIKKNTSLCGSTNNMKEKMLESSIYAMSSKTECFPMVLLESLSCGLPVVSFDCPNGPRNIIIDNKDGILVKDQNIEALASGMIQLIEDVHLRKSMGSHGRESIQRFNPKIVMNLWEELFNKTINNAI